MAVFNAASKTILQADATTIPRLVQILAALVLLLFLVKLGYGLFYSPLRHIPGSRLSAFCGFDELYTNIIMNGQWCKTYPELHRKYGSSIVRVGPNHVHVNDIDIYERIFCMGTDFCKDHTFYTCANNDGSIFSIADRAKHRERRKILSPRFSKQAAEAGAPGVLRRLQQLVDYMAEQTRMDKASDATDLMRALTINVVGEVLFGNCGDLVEYGPSKPALLDTVDNLSSLIPWLRFFPYLGAIGALFPSSISDRFEPAGVYNFKQKCKEHTLPRMDEPISPAMDRSQASLIELLIAHSHETTGNAPTLQYLTEETFTFIDAGVDTSGRTIAAAIYYIIRNPGVQQRLRAELDEAPVTDPDATSVHVKLLSTLPYLNAVIKETHRMWPALPGPLPRIVPAQGLTVGKHFVPAGVRQSNPPPPPQTSFNHMANCIRNKTVVSSANFVHHFNETIFPQPHEFRPERWLTGASSEQDRYLNPYSRGSRACIGIK
ncbi:hypothetical protein ASPCAL06851 [Aspergillus calidoustus]|uniref:Cytochrome P450 n=1 Tax=Aspergillus calidoustus TaxID=454130 RepID=A0A0U5G5R0_ASPCI|nr:hypothetical protein ASPCAL06851 [Aspergillus calidoustus]